MGREGYFSMKNNVFLALVKSKDLNSQVKRVERSISVPAPSEARVRIKDVSREMNKRFPELRVRGQIG